MRVALSLPKIQRIFFQLEFEVGCGEVLAGFGMRRKFRIEIPYHRNDEIDGASTPTHVPSNFTCILFDVHYTYTPINILMNLKIIPFKSSLF
jgi:hypothetical protein